MEGSDEITGESCVTGTSVTSVTSPSSTSRIALIRCARAALMLSNLRALSAGTDDKGSNQEMTVRVTRLLANSMAERRKELERLKHLDDVVMVMWTLVIVVAILCVFSWDWKMVLNF